MILTLLQFFMHTFTIKVMKNIRSFLILILFIYSTFSFLLNAENIFAQISSSGIAITLEIDGTEINEGDIVCKRDNVFKKCNGEYNTEMFGVVVKKPAASFEEEKKDNNYMILSSGKSVVRVSSQNGNIKKGDLITSSDREGIAVLALKNGYVLGQALEDYSSDNPDSIGTIMTAINIHPAAGLSGAKSNLITALREGITAPVFEPLDSLRYLLAALILLISFVLGFAYFGRVSKTGIEAIGRNPLASKMIQLSVLLHILITIVIILVGFGMAYVILIL